MTDIVERLRAAEAARRKSFTNALIDRDWLTEAADEIERLRDGALLLEIADLHIKIGGLNAEIERLRDRTTCLSGDIYRLRAVLLEARVLLQTWVNVSAEMSADPLLKPLREVQNSEQELLIRAQEWCRRVGPVTPAEASRFRTADDEIEKLQAQVVALQSSLEVGKHEGKKTP